MDLFLTPNFMAKFRRKSVNTKSSDCFFINDIKLNERFFSYEWTWAVLQGCKR